MKLENFAWKAKFEIDKLVSYSKNIYTKLYVYEREREREERERERLLVF